MGGDCIRYDPMSKIKKMLSTHNKIIESASRLKDWSFHCPKRYRVPKGYYDPAWYSCLELATSGGKIEGVDSADYNFSTDISFKVGEMLREYMHPHYFLDKDLIKLMQMTSITNEVDLAKIKYPYDACMFTLPSEMIEDIYNEKAEHGSRDKIGESFNYKKTYLTQLGYARSFDVQTLTQEVRAKKSGKESTDGRHYIPKISTLWSSTLEAGDQKEKAQKFILKSLEEKFGEPCRIVPSFSVVMAYDSGDV